MTDPTQEPISVDIRVTSPDDAVLFIAWDLDNWNTLEAVQTRAMRSPVFRVGKRRWTRIVSLPIDHGKSRVEFKFIKRQLNDEIIWEQGENRTLKIPDPSASVSPQIIDCGNFRDSSAKDLETLPVAITLWSLLRAGGFAILLLAVISFIWTAALRQSVPLLMGSGALVLIISFWNLPRWQYAALKRHSSVSIDRILELEDKSRATWVQTAGGIGFLLTAYFTWSQLDTTRQQAVTERFAKAIDLMNGVNSSKTGSQGQNSKLSGAEENIASGNDSKMKTKLSQISGIYTLESVAIKSDEFVRPSLEALTEYVRTHANTSDAKVNDPKVCPADIQAAMTVISELHNKQPQYTLDLSNVDLRLLQLPDGNLSNVLLFQSTLHRADLSRINMEGADLRGVDFTMATMVGGSLRKAKCNADTKLPPEVSKSLKYSCDMQ